MVWIPPPQAGGYTARCGRAIRVSNQGNRWWVNICWIRKGIHRLPQAGLLVQELLEQCLANNGYNQIKLIPGLWTHKTWSIQFCLVIDGFDIKYVGRCYAEHLQQVLEQPKCVGLTLDWEYINKQVHLSMQGCVQEALKWFNHHRPKKHNTNHTPMSYWIMVQRSNVHLQKTLRKASTNNKKIHSRSHRNLFILHESNRWNNDEKFKTISWLCCIEQWCDINIQGKQYGACGSQWCITF